MRFWRAPLALAVSLAVVALVLIAWLLARRPQPSPLPITATPAREALRRLTSGGCCTRPFWSPDSRRVLFVDRPDSNHPAAVWGVALDQPGKTPEVFTDRIGYFSAGMEYVAYPENGQTVIERRADGQRWTVDNGGWRVVFSPDSRRIAWQVVSQQDVPVTEQTAEIWVANVDGSNARRLVPASGDGAPLLGGGLAGWLSGDRLLLTGRRSKEEADAALFALSAGDGGEAELARAERFLGIAISPGGSWIVYAVALDADRGRDGVWVVRPDGSGRRRLDFFAGYQWRDASHLVYAPLRASAADGHEFWDVDAASGAKRRLTGPAARFTIAQGDWAVSPDGRQVVFVNAQDHNLWAGALTP